MIKRSIDIVSSSAAILLILPFCLLIALILRFSGEGEIFYRQTRVGKSGKLFGLLKFATMLKESPNLGAGLLTVRGDPRVLPVGKFLRKTKVNELPQFWNVLVGDMSLVGPRPQAEEHFSYFPKHVQEGIVAVRPGITGIGSIFYRDEEEIIAKSKKDNLAFYKNDIAPAKGEMELWYIANRSGWLDLKLLFLTAWVVLRPRSKLPERMFADLPTS